MNQDQAPASSAAVHRGSCLCGAVRYETTAPLQAATHCYCGMCRKAHGAAFATYAAVRAEHHRWVAGEARVQRYRSSAHVTRAFCSVCGSPLMWHSDERHAEWVAVPLGSLDSTYTTPPRKQVHTESRAAWVMACELPAPLPEEGP